MVIRTPQSPLSLLIYGLDEKKKEKEKKVHIVNEILSSSRTATKTVLLSRIPDPETQWEKYIRVKMMNMRVSGQTPETK